MKRLDASMKWIMLVSGLLTCMMFKTAIAPQLALASMFGEELPGPVAEIVVRSWGVLIGLVGLMLIYGAFRPHVRALVLLVAGTSKLVFIGLMMAFGRQYLAHQAGVAVVVDSVMVVLFSVYLLARPR